MRRWRCSARTVNIAALALFLVVWLSGAAYYLHWVVPLPAAAAPPALGSPLVPLSTRFRNESSLQRVIVTLVTQREYLVGAYALGASLRRVKTRVPLVACVTAELAAAAAVRRNLSIAGFDYVRVVERLGNPAARLGRASQRHKADVFTKLRVFQLLEFAQVLYLDADAVVRRNVDALLGERHIVPFAVAPEVTPMWRCIGQSEYVFRDELQNDDWCHGHTSEPYHGNIVKLSNTGVMLLQPSNETFGALWQLANDELQHNDTCIGMAGCNDQRVINIYYNTRFYQRLSVLYNVFCDQYKQGNFSVFRHHKPYIFHYRGQAAFKPWILKPGSARSSWNDDCGAFLDAYDRFQTLYAKSN